ncbi:MAG: MarR family transcriptional regulator [Candidatus Paralactobacillus gallistercoris]|uniref:MarR family transcriptional regulator n=1 Tax=Candidatus Paralactobacillus gallistercoris TaxID=2838724 RepID=A0A948TJF2_9LACO|nr:MarR family transcriptional regulator [Candidatus Paralactobacillus gallistercoris]
MAENTSFTTMTVSEKKAEITRIFFDIYTDILSIEKNVLKDSPYNDLSPTDVSILHAIGLNTPQTFEVSDALNVSKSTLTTRLANLEKKGYIHRYLDDNDKRSIRIALTERGMALYHASNESHQLLVDAFLENFDEKELNDCYTALTVNLPEAMMRLKYKYRSYMKRS